MAEELYHRIAGYGTSPIPSGDINGLVEALHEVIEDKPPSTLAQKRTWLNTWFEEQAGKYGPPPEPPAEPEPPVSADSAGPGFAAEPERRD